MKNLIVTCSFVFATVFSFAQDSEVVKETISFKQAGDNVEMTIELAIDSSWIVYDSIAGDDGPIPFSMTVDESSPVKLMGVKKPNRYKKHDELFEMDIYYLKGKVFYVFNFSKKTIDSLGELSGSYEFMSCNLSSGVCLPPSQYGFSYSVK